MRQYFSFAVLMWASVLTNAADVYCDGAIEDWDVTKSGAVYVDGVWNNSAESQRMCLLSGDFDGVSAETCKAWLSIVMAAKMGSRQVRLKYSNMASCDAAVLGTWNNTVKAPEYIRVY